MTDTTVVTTATDATADTSTAATDAGKPNPHAGFQRRIDQLTREKHDLRRQLETLQRPAPKQEQAAEDDKSLADFEYDEVAYRKHIREVAAEEARKAARGVLDETKQKEVQQSRSKTWKERAAKFAEAHPDFTQKVYAEDIQISESMFEAIADSEYGPEVAYYLADNPEEAERISKLSAAAAGRAIGRIESKFEASKETAAEASKEAEQVVKQEPRVTKAPAPPPKLEATDSGSKLAWNDPKLSQEEFNKRRRAYQARR